MDLTTRVLEMLEDVPHTRVTRRFNEVVLRYSPTDNFDGWSHTTFTVHLPSVSWTGSINQCRITQEGSSLPTASVIDKRATAALLEALADVQEDLASEEVLAPLREEADRKQEEARAERERQREEARKRREELERLRQERAKLTAERSERLLTEFMGEKVRIRLDGYKRWRPATVEAEERQGENGTYYLPVFRYVFERHGYKEYGCGHVRALEVKVGSRYKNVWNDGNDDLPTWEQGKEGKVSAAYDADAQQ